jgi:shikimate dehydrogenase
MDVYGLLGNPVEHSLSPPMHEAAYEALDYDARYVTFETDPDAVDAALDGAKALGIEGLNVTIPFKETIAERVACDETARRVGAVNTIDFGGDDVTGHNTDVEGVRRALAHHDVALDGATAILVGAGGAGRAVAFALADAGAAVHVANRTTEKAVSLAQDLPAASAHDLDEVPALLSEADLLANATSVGMESDDIPVPASALHEDLAVFDAVYTPLDTRLLSAAEAVGAQTIDGAWMLLYQGVAALELWTDRDPPVADMNRALRAELA